MVLVPLCEDLCPATERQRRVAEKNVSRFERAEGGEPIHALMLKEYRRPAAGHTPDPLEVRTGTDARLCNADAP